MLQVVTVELTEDSAWVQVEDDKTGRHIELRVDVDDNGEFEAPWCVERNGLLGEVVYRYDQTRFHSD